MIELYYLYLYIILATDEKKNIVQELVLKSRLVSISKMFK